jgi:hypothetical protein
MTSPFAVPRFVAFRHRGSWRARHEAGHIAVAVRLGCPVYSARIDERGGVTSVGGDPRDLILISLGGCAAERVLGDRDSDIRCSASDYEKAYRYGIEVARSEERSAPVSVPPSGQPRKETGHGGPITPTLSAVSVAEVESGADRVAAAVAARWLARAHVLVDAAEVEVFELLSADRRGLGLIAERLEQHRNLDAIDVIAIAAEAGLEQEDRRKES